MTRVLLFSLCCVAFIAITRQSATADQDLGIGSPAPALDIEHWVQDGNGFFKPVTKFEKDKVYVIEFWATWCGPCIMSMPHLAELQNKYRGRGVQIVSISDESLDEVKDLLGQKNPDEGKTFGDITSAYSLTTDPDRSAHKAYMEASKQQGIPTSFIVGKSGKIEWIGHPMELDEPLEAVVTDSWDREQFRKEHQAKADFEVAMQKLSLLAGKGKFDDAIKLVDKQIKKAELEQMKIQWTDIRYSLKVSAGQIDDDVVAYYRSHIEDIKDDPIALSRFGYSLYGVHQQGGDVGVLADDVIKAILAVQDETPEDAAVFVYNTLAQLYVVKEDFKQAVDFQQKAVDAASARQKSRLTPFLEELKEKAGIKPVEPDADESEDKDSEDKAESKDKAESNKK